MSHFSVLVIGDDPEKQLAAYHRSEYTVMDDPYLQDRDITDRVRSIMVGLVSRELALVDRQASAWEDELAVVEALSVFGLSKCIVEWESMVDRGGPHRYGYAIIRNRELIKAVVRTNPNKKWDSYVLGGAYSRLLKLRDGCDSRLTTRQVAPGYANQVRKGAIDFDGMRDAAEREARAKYRRFYALLGDTLLPRTYESLLEKHAGNWATMLNSYLSQMRQEYSHLLEFCDGVGEPDLGKEFACTEDEYAERARNAAISPYAVVKEGKWYEPPLLALASNEKDKYEWDREVSRLLDSIDNDTLVSVYECRTPVDLEERAADMFRKAVFARVEKAALARAKAGAATTGLVEAEVTLWPQ